MKKATLLCGMLLAISATMASAGAGVNIRWDTCLGGGGTPNKASACNSNSGGNQMVGSFQVPDTIRSVSGLEVVIDLGSQGLTLPAWWQFKNLGSCRSTSLVMNFTAGFSGPCANDWSQGGASGGIGAYNIGQRGPNTARIVAAIAVPQTGLVELDPGNEYFAFNITINNVKTTGTGACTGCDVPVCIQWNSVRLTTPNPQIFRLIVGPTFCPPLGPPPFTNICSDFCEWQGPVAVTIGDVTGCNAAVPTRNTTWSAVKSLYR